MNYFAIYIFCYFLIIFNLTKSSPLSSPPSSPSDSFFDLTDDPFAGQLAKTFGNRDQAPVKPLTNLEPGEVNSMNSGKDKEYVYKPRKKESQYKKGKHVELVRSIQARVREDPIRREEVLQYKRHYYHARKNDPNFERKYHRFGSKILPLKELIKMEKNGTINESQKEQLKHQRNLKKLQNQKQREKSRSNAQANSARSKDSKGQF